ncbi:MAG: 2-C-methyl-D-erythritol 2,4-cyclodiphosphate synthase [Azoarcus sp.]|jgi:2-C-methyl-D-erythritol 2,4-cyclodiphosphate synthase|nr:2-C-methyl-D-erythritol 2,4-cyclodiphosphate synthase [Azoarcus sp.]
MKPEIRIGQGFDVHAFTPESPRSAERLAELPGTHSGDAAQPSRPLILGGVAIPFPRGLVGHSDADVLLHAITDAVLGAAGQGDIGRLFPDTDPQCAGADSRVLLRTAFARVKAAGWQAVNVDATIICQQPKIAPLAAQMAANIAADLGIAADAVNIKGKTTEKLGFTGRGEGIAAQAVALLVRRK